LKFGPISAEKDSRSVNDLLFCLNEEDSGSQHWAERDSAPALSTSFGEPTVSNYEACQQLFDLRRQLAAKRPGRGAGNQQMMQQGGPAVYPNGMMQPQMGMQPMPMQNPQMGNMPPQMVGGPMNMNGMPVAPVQGMAPMQGGGMPPAQMQPDMSQQGPPNAPMMGQNMNMGPPMNQNMNMGQPMNMPAGQGPQGQMPPQGPQGQMGPGGPGQMPNQMQGNWQQGQMGQPSQMQGWQNASPQP
jgi:hypothetical protein